MTVATKKRLGLLATQPPDVPACSSETWLAAADQLSGGQGAQLIVAYMRAMAVVVKRCEDAGQWPPPPRVPMPWEPDDAR
jgi:hypothetical protein